MGSERVYKVIKVKIIFIIIFLHFIIKSQDSLYWFNMSTVIDKMPNSPKVFDDIYGKSQFDIIDSLRNIRITTRDGYRLQVFESSSAEEINTVINKFDRILSDSLYMIFEAPLYKIHYGNFMTKNKAEIAKSSLKNKGLKNIWVVKSRIDEKISKEDLEN